MKQFSENAVVATAKEMNNTGLFPHYGPTDNLLLWIKWNWSGKSKDDHFAPMVDITYERTEESTHKIVGEEMFFKLSIKEDGSVPFEEFINRFVVIESI
ncbi:MAG: hypothetical protein H6Q18_44 [Bacteroidetes bacterium]|nr:hypothetical protein [Bacteroidota bacterium]